MTDTAGMPTQFTIEISPPVSFNSRDYAQLVLREPTGSDMLAGDEQIKNGMNAWTLRNRQYHMIARCADVPFNVVTKLPARTLNQAWNFIGPFYDAGLETGGN